MRQAMAGQGGLADLLRVCKRVTVVSCAIANLAVTLYVLQILLGHSSQPSEPSSSPSFVNCLRSWSPYRLQMENLKKLQEVRRNEANEFRRQSAPLELIRRVREIEAEAAMDSPRKEAPTNPPLHQKSEQEEMQEQLEIETEQEGGAPAVEDDELGAIERLLPPECHPEPNTDFGGIAVRWGLTHHVNTAAECCKACLWHAAYANAGRPKCNVWVFCPETNGCVSPDGYEHKFGECWLKHADQPQPTVHDYSLVMHSSSASPLPVLWLSGVTTSSDSR